MSTDNKHETPKENAANNLGLHLTELHTIIKSLQADLARSRRALEKAAKLLAAYWEGANDYNPAMEPPQLNYVYWIELVTAQAAAEGKDA